MASPRRFHPRRDPVDVRGSWVVFQRAVQAEGVARAIALGCRHVLGVVREAQELGWRVRRVGCGLW